MQKYKNNYIVSKQTSLLELHQFQECTATTERRRQKILNEVLQTLATKSSRTCSNISNVFSNFPQFLTNTP